MFKKGDIVRIVSQPAAHLCSITGEVGYLDAVAGDDMGSFCGVKIDGSVGGGGWVPLSCLELETRAEWLAAVEKYRTNIANMIEESRKRSERFDNEIRRVAAEHKVSADTAAEIFVTLRDFDPSH